MIKVKGGKVEVNGFLTEVLADASTMLTAIHENLVEKFGKEIGDDLYAKIIETAEKSDDEIEEETKIMKEAHARRMAELFGEE